MSKKYRSKKSREKAFTRLFIGMLALAAILVVVLIVVSFLPAGDGLVVTADGHVHDAAGNHIGNYDEMVADGTLVVTEDGHIHDTAGNHIGDASDLLTDDSLVVTEDGHVHDAEGNHIGTTDELLGTEEESEATEEPAQTEE